MRSTGCVNGNHLNAMGKFSCSAPFAPKLTSRNASSICSELQQTRSLSLSMDAMNSYPINFSGNPVASDRTAKKAKQQYWPTRKGRMNKAAFEWLRRQSLAVKIGLAATTAVCALVALKLSVKNHNHFFVAAEVIHAAGLLVLVYKLTTHKTCSGLSSKTQELTALFLAVRLVCGAVMEVDIHTVLDFITFISTAWVIYMIRFKLNKTYVKALDNFPLYYVVLPAIVLSAVIHPYAHHNHIVCVFWAFGTYVESVSVLPQLRLMQNAKMIEPFTAHYVFALGVSRFLAFAHWVIQVYDTRGRYLFLVGSGYFWFFTAFLSEIVQTFILADFCYYYIKSLVQGRLRMPV